MKKVLSTKDIMEIMEIGENTAYKLIKEAEYTGIFRVIKIGKVYRISAESFMNWLDGKEEADL